METRRDFLTRGVRVVAALGLAPSLRLAPAERTTDPRLRSLERVVRGPVLTPASPSYDAARRVVNSRYDGIRPLAVFRPLDARDVQAVVRWAARTRVPIVARSGGHSYAGYSTTHGVVVDLRRLAHVAVHPGGRATVGAGARLGDVYAVLGAHGVAIPAGSCPSVGIGGSALGGGFGLASRAWGLTCDTLEQVEIVTADGRLRTCDATHEPDLFWACRGGGGGNFGIATRFVFRTKPVDAGSWFVATFDWSDAAAVVARFLATGIAAPDALGPVCRLATGTPPTVEVFGQYLGPEADLRTHVATLLDGLSRASLRTGSSSWLELVGRWANCNRSLHECAQPVQVSFAAGSDYLDRALPGSGLAALARAVEREHATSAMILVDAYGGALSRVPADATAFVHRRMLASCQYYARGEAAAAQTWVDGTRAAMAPYVTGFAYQNYVDPRLTNWAHAYYGANVPRLRRVKRRYDPQGLFHFPQGIRP